MVNSEYEKFYNQKVGVITTGVAADINYHANSSLVLEGILDKETDTQIFLKGLNDVKHNGGYLDIDSSYGTISKDKIISLYLIGKFKVKKVEKKKIEGPELIEDAKPKPA